MGRWDTSWGETAWWSAAGWIIYANGEKSAWPPGLSEADGLGVRTDGTPGRGYRQFVPSRGGGHLYYAPQVGQLINSKTGDVHAVVNPHSINPNFQQSYIITLTLIPPPTRRHRPRWMMNCALRAGANPQGPADPWCGTAFREWPPRSYGAAPY
jgi:hypothetical protein